jgi:hypothetical protein
MLPADLLLAHFDSIAGSEPSYRQISPEGEVTAMNVAVYRNYPLPSAITGFTIGLSHFHPADGGHIELTISMLDLDEVWALAVGYVALKAREHFRFGIDDTIDFGAQISTKSEMSAFVVTHPAHLGVAGCAVDIGVRRVTLVELVPIYQEERVWLLAGRTFQDLLGANPRETFMNPRRGLLVPRTAL